jgi:tRNA threonylcarbamoyl adenosine modification protein YeaZ
VRLLSFDTSTDKLQLCLFEDGKPVVERSGYDGAPTDAGHRQQMVAYLMPMIEEAMEEAGWPKESFGCIVVGQGPGSFTGIRSGVVTARTLAQALKLPLIAVCLLETVASECALPSAVVLAAGKGHYFVAAYDAEPANSSQPSAIESVQNLKTMAAPAYVSPQELIANIGSVRRWAVDKACSLPAELCDGHEVVELPNVKNIATRQAQIAWNRLSLTMSNETNGKISAGGAAESLTTERENRLRERLSEIFAFEAVQPLYLRSPSVTIKANTQQNANENQADAPGRHR